MNISGLSFNALPPIDLPFRFFISAPILVLLCAGIILFSGEAMWLSRWHPSTLAVTHGFTLGFITMVMMGALLQLLPVIGGIGIAKPRLIATSCHGLFTLGTLSLMANFLWPNAWLLVISFLLLSLGLGIYIAALAWVLVKKLSQGDAIIGFRFAITALVIVFFIGLLLLARTQAGFYEWGWPTFLVEKLSTKALTDGHAIWGLVGWVGLLIISVSFQVIPMFHVAPSFPTIISRYLPAIIFLILLGMFVDIAITLNIIVLLHGVYAISLFLVIAKRKRKVPDNTIRYWLLAATSLLLFNGFYFFPEAYLTQEILTSKTLILAAFFIYFYLVSVIQGMLLKILPFLSYTHLQQRCLSHFSAMQFIPHMHEFLQKKHGLWLFNFHCFTGIVLLMTIMMPSIYWLLSIMLFVEFCWLLKLMYQAITLYYKTLNKIKLSVNE
ncbi:MAG: hypothetical protein OQK09_04985 [Colwellia sp.]|nr:hypothetical protein [Colwellia sp.]MCW8864432.1 hypothetical protein [Colwellia sp.]MCW9080845.1 hypothetical protein [Colwellia sp.]